MEKTEVKDVVQTTNDFVKLVDLTKEQVKKFQKDDSFVVLPVTFKRGFSKSGTETVSITVEIQKPYMQQLRLKNGNDYIRSSKFHSLLIATSSDYKDATGRDINIWKKSALCRFVKGSYANREGEYYSLEVLFKQGHYLVHFFDYDEDTVNRLLPQTINFIDGIVDLINK